MSDASLGEIRRVFYVKDSKVFSYFGVGSVLLLGALIYLGCRVLQGGEPALTSRQGLGEVLW